MPLLLSLALSLLLSCAARGDTPVAPSAPKPAPSAPKPASTAQAAAPSAPKPAPSAPIMDAAALELFGQELIRLYPLRQSAIVAIAPFGPADPSTASGVLISADGLVLSAGHILALRQDKDAPAKITLADGSTRMATPLGADYSADLSLWRITDTAGLPQPAPLAQADASSGSPLFILGHPDVYVRSRQAQMRVGFIRASSAGVFFADANIQPGDSGGGAFNARGELIGLCCAAAQHLDFNAFCPVSVILARLEALKSGRRSGDASHSLLTIPADLPQTLRQRQPLLRAVLDQRLAAGHRPTLDFLKTRGYLRQDILEITEQGVIDCLGADVIPLASSPQCLMGRSDPALLRILPAALRPCVLELRQEGRAVAYATLLAGGLAVTKHSNLLPGQPLQAHLGAETFTASLAKIHADADLAFLRLDHLPAGFQAPLSAAVPAPGSLLITSGPEGLLGWGCLASPAHILFKGAATGPLTDPAIVSRIQIRNLPILSHDAHIQAGQEGAALCDRKGHLVGITIMRKNRCLSASYSMEQVERFLAEAPVARVQPQ